MQPNSQAYAQGQMPEYGAGTEGEEVPDQPVQTARCMYYDQGTCRHGDGCYYYHPGRFQAALTDMSLDRVDEYVANACQCAQRLLDADGMIVLKYMRDLFLEDIREVGYMSTDTIDDVMAKAVGVPVAYEVPWYRTVPLKTFIQLVCLKLRGAPWHICLRSCVIGKTIAMIAMHSSHISIMMKDGTKWLLNKADHTAPDYVGAPVSSWLFGKETALLGREFSVASPYMAKAYCYRYIKAITVDPDAAHFQMSFADERPCAAWACKGGRRLRSFKPEVVQTIISFFAPAEEVTVCCEVAGSQSQIQGDVYLHPHI